MSFLSEGQRFRLWNLGEKTGVKVTPVALEEEERKCVKVIVVTLPERGPREHFTLLSDMEEDLGVKFMKNGLAALQEVSRVNELRIEIFASRHVGEVTTFIKKRLKHYGLTDFAEITRSDR